VICNHIDLGGRAFQIMAPALKRFEDGQKFLVVNIVVEFGGCESSGVESDGVKFAVQGMSREYGG
jgi:hypothetical protein